MRKEQIKAITFGKGLQHYKKIVKYKNTVNFLGFMDLSNYRNTKSLKSCILKILLIKSTASSKLLEAIFFSNKIIVSRNTGALNELKEFSLELLFN